MRVLIVDDNHDLAEGLAALLRARGSEAIVALDGDRGLQLSKQGPWDAALIDLKLPRRAGEEILRKLAGNGRPAHLYAMTGYESPRRLAAVEALDIDGVLRKPFDVGSLLATLVPDEAPPARGQGRIGVLGAGPDDLDCTCVEDAEALVELVLGDPLDAVVVPASWPDAEELIEDLHVLDRELAVVRSDHPSLLEAAVDRTLEARRRAGEHATLEAAFAAAPAASLLIGGTPTAILRWTREAEALLGWSAQELGKLSPGDLDEPGSARLHSLLEDANGDGSWTPCVARIRGGELRPVYAHALRVGPEQVLLNLKPRDDRGSHEEALQLLGATAAGVAHEMRNAMASVGSSLAILHARLDKESREYGILGGIRARVDKASEVMNDLLAFARPVELRLKTVPATMFLKAVANQLRDGAPEGIAIATEVPDPTLRVLIDPARVQMALLNLGTNALTAMGEAGTLTLRCERKSSWIELTVRDDGPGIPEALRRRIFEPFFTTRAHGTGLGLANVRKLVQAHGGRIQLLDEGPGASFLIRLPPRPEVMEVPA